MRQVGMWRLESLNDQKICQRKTKKLNVLQKQTEKERKEKENVDIR